MRNNPQNPKETEVQDFPWGRILHAHNLFCLVKNKTLVTSFPPVKSMTFNFPSLSWSSPSPRPIKAGAFNLLPRCFDHRRATYVHTFLDIFRYLQAPKFELLFHSAPCGRGKSLCQSGRGRAAGSGPGPGRLPKPPLRSASLPGAVLSDPCRL